MLAFYVLPYGQHMPKREPYVVEVLFVPLPANEMEERRRRLRALVLTGAVRLAREPDISRPSPRLTSVIADSVGLARMILERVVR